MEPLRRALSCRSFIPRHGTVAAYLALMLSMTGGAYAAGAGAGASPRLQSGAPAKAGAAALAAGLRSASVSSDGTLKGGVGAASAQRAGQGKYKVTFAADVSGCAVTAFSAGASTNSSTYAPAQVNAGAVSGSAAYVTTMNGDGNPADIAFSVLAACKGDPAPAEAQVLYANVTSSGALGKQLGASAAARGGQGKYSVTFSQDISGCLLGVSSAEAHSSSNTYTPGQVAATVSGSKAYVTTMNGDGNPADLSFAVIAACPSGIAPSSSSSKQRLLGASLSSSGALGVSLGASSSARANQGKYTVSMSSSVAGCATAVTNMNGSSAANAYSPGMTAAAASGSTSYLNTMNGDGNPADLPAHALILCPASPGTGTGAGGGLVRPGTGLNAGELVSVPDTRSLYANVTSAGKLDSGAGARKAKRIGTGRYDVTFKVPADGCGVAVTSLGGSSSPNAYHPAQVSAHAPSGTKVSVTTMDEKGLPQDDAFSVTVTCPVEG